MQTAPVCLFVASLILLSAPAAPQSSSSAELEPAAVRERMAAVLQRQQLGSDLPINEGASTNAEADSRRVQRARHFNTQKGRKLEAELIGDAPVIDIAVHTESYGPALAALPFAQSDAVVRGTVKVAKALLSDDETDIYSEFEVHVDEVIKQPRDGSIQEAALVTVLRHGGALRVGPTLIRVRNAEETMPMVGGKYILFLKRYSEFDAAFLLVTGYGLNGEVTALDTRGTSLRWEGAGQSDLLSALAEQRQ